MIQPTRPLLCLKYPHYATSVVDISCFLAPYLLGVVGPSEPSPIESPMTSLKDGGDNRCNYIWVPFVDSIESTLPGRFCLTSP